MSQKSGKWSRNIIQKRAAYPYCGCISSVSDKYERIQTDGYCIHRQMTTTCTNRFAFPHKYLKNLSRSNLQTSLLVKKCLFGFYRPTRKFFTHMKTSPLPLKVSKVWPMLDTHDHLSVRVLHRATPTVTRGIRLNLSSPKNRDTHAYCRAFSSELALPVFTT